MLTYTFDHTGHQSLYEYLYTCIKEDIMKGNLKPHEKLPSKRSFAKHLGISTITVENSYGQLMSEGYIYSIAKKGYFVSDITDKTKVKPISTSSIQLPNKKEYELDLSNNQTDPNNFPFSIWNKLLRETLNTKSHQLMEKSPGTGIYDLRVAIANHLRSFRGMDVDPDQIIIGAGTEYLYGLCIQLLGRDKIYCVEDPGYQKITQIYQSQNVSIRYASLDEKGCKVENAEDAQVVHITPTHHFPTGITMPIDRRYEWLAWANARKDRYIIEDDYDSEFRLNGRPIPSLQSIDVSNRVIYINTFSKSLSPTIRISYMVLPVSLMNLYYQNLNFYACTVSNFEQYTLAEFISQGYFEKHINRMRLHYAKQREQLLQYLKKSTMSKHCTFIEKDSGLHVLMKLETSMTDDELIHRLSKKHIHISSLSEFYQEPKDQHVFVLNDANITMDQLKSFLKILKQIIQEETPIDNK